MTTELIAFLVMVGVFLLGCFLCKLPVSLSMVLASVAGAIAGGQGLALRHLVEGMFAYVDTIMVIATAMIFMKVIQESGALDAIASLIIQRFHKVPALMLIFIMVIIMFPGMITGSSTASVLSAGSIMAPVLMIMGVPVLETACILALGGVLGMIAPPTNIPAMIIGAGIDITKIADVIGAGFSGTFTSIGIVIILGALVGILLEKTGAAIKMAECVVKLVGKKHPEAAMIIMGWIVSIPVFCDSGFVILNPIRKALVQRTRKSSVACSVALSMGLYISHCFIPPTPGPIAAANTLYGGMGLEVNLLLVMGIGALCSILPMIAGYVFALFIGKKVKAADEPTNAEAIGQTYEELVASYGKLPSAWLAFAPIVVPIILMGLASAFSMAGVKADFISFLGTPIIALAVGCIIAIISLFAANKGKDFYKLTDDTLKTVGPILFVTAAGGVLGKVIASSDMVNFIKANAEIFESIGIFFPFLLAAILKSAQGSSTVAITTTAGIVAPLLPVLGLDSPALSCLTVIAIGAGAMTVSHANDSYFWVVTNFGEMTPQDGYKTQTLGTLVIGVVSIIGVFIVSLFLH